MSRHSIVRGTLPELSLPWEPRSCYTVVFRGRVSLNRAAYGPFAWDNSEDGNFMMPPG